MGNWKTKYKVGDLADERRIKMICKKCNRHVNITKTTICKVRGRKQLFLDEIENRTRCKAQGCGGRMRMVMDRQDEMSGFAGGLD